MRRLLLLAIAASSSTLALVAACSSDESSGGSGGGSAGTGASSSGGQGAANGDASLGGSAGGGSGGASGAGGSASGGASGGGSGGASGSGGGSAKKGGTVTLTQAVAIIGSNQYPSYSFSAGFVDQVSAATGNPCKETKAGACTVLACTTPNPDPDAGPPPAAPQASAGNIAVTGALEALTLAPKADGSYDFLGGSKLMWNDKASLTITAAGGKVPAFSATLQGAGPLLVTSPKLDPASPMTINRSQPFALTWPGASVGTATVVFVRSVKGATTTDSTTLRCEYPASDGKATIAASALQNIPAGPNGSVSVYAGAAQQVTAGDWLVYVTEISGSNVAQATFQ